MFFSDVSPIVSVSLEDTGTDTVGSIISMNLVARGMFGLSAENAHLNASTLFIPPYNALFTRRIEELRDGAKARWTIPLCAPLDSVGSHTPVRPKPRGPPWCAPCPATPRPSSSASRCVPVVPIAASV